MPPVCLKCKTNPKSLSQSPKVVRRGYFRRKSDRRWIQRFQCTLCKSGFSRATGHPCFGQNKRHQNTAVRNLLCSGVSQRRSARLLGLSRATVARKLVFLAMGAEAFSQKALLKKKYLKTIEFDDVETFEHSKCKPLSITVAVEYDTRYILGFEVKSMPAKGKLAAVSRLKYGRRKDERYIGRRALFRRLKPVVHPHALIKSDQSPHYPKDVKRFFPNATHETHKGRRGCVVGQGELKKIGFDPLFTLNHTAAMLRANINRLFRRTWCTTKRADRLAAHLAIYMNFHNEILLKT